MNQNNEQQTTAVVDEETKEPSPCDQHVIEYMPLGESSKIELTIDMVRTFLTRPTRSGAQPSDADVIRFMMMCRARALNPWVGDAFLVGYDTRDGPEFSLITAHQALAKRSEVAPQFDGIESGVIVDREGEVQYREGDMTFDGEQLLGGWARVYRKDRDKAFYQALRLSVYDKNKSRWNVDKAGMIVKCAEAGAYRQAFPTQCGGLYTQEEQATIQATIADGGEPPALPDGKQAFGFREETKATAITITGAGSDEPAPVCVCGHRFDQHGHAPEDMGCRHSECSCTGYLVTDPISDAQANADHKPTKVKEPQKSSGRILIETMIGAATPEGTNRAMVFSHWLKANQFDEAMLSDTETGARRTVVNAAKAADWKLIAALALVTA